MGRTATWAQLVAPRDATCPSSRSSLMAEEATVPTPDGDPLSGPQAIVFCQLLGARDLDQSCFCASDLDVFRTSKGFSSVECYHRQGRPLVFSGACSPAWWQQRDMHGS